MQKLLNFMYGSEAFLWETVYKRRQIVIYNDYGHTDVQIIKRREKK